MKNAVFYAAFLPIIWIKPRVKYHYARRFQIVSPAKPKKNYRMNVDQFFPKFVAPHKFSQPYNLFVRHNCSNLAKVILNLYDDSKL